MPVGFDHFGTRDSSTGTAVSTNYPYYKYTWTASFEFDGGDTGENEFTDEDAAAITLRTFEMPRWTSDTQVVNVYNHKTLVQTKLNWEPITITFYDQQNDAVEKLVWSFVKGQFDPNDGSKAARKRPLKITVKMHKFSGGDIETADNKTYVLENAYIVDAQHDTLDYSTSDAVLWTVSIRFENLTWSGGFEGEPPTSSAGVPPKPAEPKPPGKIDYTPPFPDIPDASPGLMELEGFTDPYGTTDAAAIMGAVNYNPKGLSKVLDEQRSREKASKQVVPPGGDSEPTYTGYEGGFVPTPPGENAQGFSPSTGTATSTTNTSPDSGSRRVDLPSAQATFTAKTADPSTISSSKTEQISKTPSYWNDTNRVAQEERDRLKAAQTGQTVSQVRDARARNVQALDKAIPDNSWY